jgi:hypothetical protein
MSSAGVFAVTSAIEGGLTAGFSSGQMIEYSFLLEEAALKPNLK